MASLLVDQLDTPLVDGQHERASACVQTCLLRLLHVHFTLKVLQVSK